jgi:ribonuclease Z
MKVTFLGTSSGTPTKSRNVSACVVAEEQSKSWFLIDCGEGTQHRLLHTPYSLLNLKAIFITHIHGDHCYGLPGLLASAGLLGRTAPLMIVATKGIKELVEAVLSNTDLHIGYELSFRLPEDAALVLESGMTNVTAVKLSHRVESYAYQFTEQKVEPALQADKLVEFGIPQGPLWGKLKRGETIVLENGQKVNGRDFLSKARNPRSIIVSGDNDKPELLVSACKTADVLIHEATYTEEILLQVGERVQHCSAQRIATFAESIGLANLVLTHFSPRFADGDSDGCHVGMLESEAQSFYSGNLVMASDLASYRLNKNGKFELDN